MGGRTSWDGRAASGIGGPVRDILRALAQGNADIGRTSRVDDWMSRDPVKSSPSNKTAYLRNRMTRPEDTERRWEPGGAIALGAYVALSLVFFGLHVLPHMGTEVVG